MARTMVGVAVMQAMLGIAIATAPVTAAAPDGPFKALLFGSGFAALWLTSAGCFWLAAKSNRKAAMV
jgi:hypothetical protein